MTICGILLLLASLVSLVLALVNICKNRQITPIGSILGFAGVALTILLYVTEFVFFDVYIYPVANITATYNGNKAVYEVTVETGEVISVDAERAELKYDTFDNVSYIKITDYFFSY